MHPRQLGYLVEKGPGSSAEVPLQTLLQRDTLNKKSHPGDDGFRPFPVVWKSALQLSFKTGFFACASAVAPNVDRVATFASGTRVTPAEIEKILAASESVELRAVITLAVETSMRRGELVTKPWRC